MQPTLVMQSEAAECGLACVAMIAAANALPYDLRRLRAEFPPSRSGASLRTLINVLDRIGVATRGVRVEMDELPCLRMPAVLHWNLNHFVVLVAADARTVTILDPAAGRRRISRQEASGCFSGVALEVVGVAAAARAGAVRRPRLRDLIGDIAGLKSALARVLVLALGVEAFALLGPLFMQWTVDQAILAGDANLIVLLAAAFAFLLVCQAGFTTIRNWFVARVGMSLSTQWSVNLHAHLLRLPVEYFNRRLQSDIVTRFQSVGVLQRLVTSQMSSAVIDGFLAIFAFIVIASYNFALALLPLASTLVYLGARMLLFPRLQEQTSEQLVATAKQQGLLYESVRGIQTIRLAGMEPMRAAAYANATVDVTNRVLRLHNLELGTRTFNQLLFGFERIAIVALGALAVTDAAMTVGMLIAFIAYKDQFTARTSALVDAVTDLRTMRLHAERIAEIALAEPEAAGPASAPARRGDGPPEIEFRGVGFRYGADDPWVLRNVSFRIRPGESVAIAGASGSGKTTIAKLLLGLYAPSEGEIFVDGRPLAHYGVANLRRIAGSVMQDEHLYIGSVRDNIDGFDPDSRFDDIEAAATLAAIHADIASLPLAYETPVGDMGAALSGGQRQRLVLARALYRRPTLLVLDEATSHLDVAHERAVNDAIRALGITRILIAHRPETIASAERCLHVANGTVTDSDAGTEPSAARAA